MHLYVILDLLLGCPDWGYMMRLCVIDLSVLDGHELRLPSISLEGGGWYVVKLNGWFGDDGAISRPCGREGGGRVVKSCTCM